MAEVHIPQLDLDRLEAFRVSEGRRWHAVNPWIKQAFCGLSDPSLAQDWDRWLRVSPRCGQCERCIRGIARRFAREQS